MLNIAKLDPLYEAAKNLVLEIREPSISLLQRHLKIGYSRALSLMALLESNVVTPADDSGYRRMLTGVTFAMSEEPYCEGLDDWILDEEALLLNKDFVSVKCFSKRGVGKSLNEDAVLLPGMIYLGTPRKHGCLDLSKPRYFAIADGMSGGEFPNKASFRLLGCLDRLLEEVQDETIPRELLHRLQKMFASLSNDPRYLGMASTLIGVQLIGNAANIFNVGDSRAYLLTTNSSGCHAKLLSRDHNQLNDMLDAGELTPAQAESAATLYRGLTSQFIVDPDYDELQVKIVKHTLQQGERLLLCSDGLNEVLSDSEIAALFAEKSDEALLKAYMASRRAGGVDDFSVIVLEVMKAS